MKNILKVLIISSIFAPISFAIAQEIAKVDTIEGEVTFKLAAENDFKNTAIGQGLAEQDVIKTGRHGRAGIVFSDGFLLRIAENTTIQLKARAGEKGKEVSVESGKAYFFSREPKEFPLIATPAVTTAIRGTEFVVIASPLNTQVVLLDGAVECFNKFGKVALSPGEQSTTKLGEAPVKSIILNPTDAVQWALSYPVLITPGTNANGYLKEIKNTVALGNSAKALEMYESLKPNQRSPETDLYAANIYLSVGQVDKAQEILDKAAKSGNKSSDLLSLRSVIALIRNEKDSAKSQAAEAYAADSTSSAAVLSNAYVAQANFDLEGAKNWYKKLTEIDTNNAFAYAKLAELELGSGDFNKAEKYINQAKSISPENTFVMSVDGFLKLFKDHTEEAISIFTRVIEKDSNLAVARLGLGLAKIHKGEVEAGREQLKTAAFLEPQTAIYRSYLGKAYFEEENEKMAGHEYQRAIELDPKDPTAYLYRAYNSLSQNRPVDALNDVEKSIELNNNRAVYRSSLLLDQDAGVKSANLAEVFTTLGFAEVARVEAVKSLNKNYTNYSAHRLLADSYNTIFLNDARVSERKLFDLLAPLTFNAFSFRQASDNASLNEYNALFDRDESRTYLGGDFETGDDLLMPSVFHTAKKGDFAYLLGFDGAYTGGSKENNYSELNRGHLALQYQPNLENRFILQSSGLYRKREDNNDAYSETKFEDYDIDLGYTHRFSQNSKLIAEATYGNQRNNFADDMAERFATAHLLLPDEPTDLDVGLLVDEFSREKVKSTRGTMQYLFDSNLVSFVAGSQIYYADQDRREDSMELFDDQGLFSEIDYTLKSKGMNDLDAQDYYLYTTWHLSDAADFNLGGTFSEIELGEREFPAFSDETVNRSKFSPKVGLTLYPTETTTIRAAYFETLRKSSLEDTGSLEPTLVGGINQRFTDLPGADSRNIGVGIDQKITNSSYFGVEGLRRHKDDHFNLDNTEITIDYTALTINTDYSTVPYEDHSDENIAKAYFYQVLCKESVATLDYQWTGFNRDQDGSEDLDTQVHKIATGLRYFNKQGWFAFTNGTWREQNRQGYFPDEANGNNNFWIVDAGVGYRIPKRHGSIILQVNNIFDQDFNYDQSLGLEEYVRPDTSAALIASFNF
jgi:Tfp pilus assembly protein PilF